MSFVKKDKMEMVETGVTYGNVPPKASDLPHDPGPSAAMGVEMESQHPMARFQRGSLNWCRRYSFITVKVVLFILLVVYTVYLAFAIRHNLNNATALIVITIISVSLIIYVLIRNHFGKYIYKYVFQPIGEFLDKHWHWMKWIVIPAVVIGFILYLVLDVVRDVKQLQSLSGIVVFITYLYFTSKHPEKVIWRPVITGFIMQFIMAVIVLRWRYGYIAVKWLSDQITTFIGYSFAGASAVFGDPMFLLHPVAFVAMPMLIYVGAVMSILFYCGLTQVLAAKVGWFMQIVMKTTAIESLAVAANIFLNGLDVMLMLRPYLFKLTKSEFHCFLVGNHSTVAGFVFALFVLFGAPPQHLLSAAVMSAPAVFAVSKLNYPETQQSETKDMDQIELQRGEETNVIEAGANGASMAGKTVAAVIVNFIGFLSLLEFINVTLKWLGQRVGYEGLSFQTICSYLFFPLALVMGVELNNCRDVAALVGIKVFTSEVIAYQELGEYRRQNRLSARSVSIATYALCGFSGLSTLAIAVGVWNAVVPSKTKDMASQMLRVIVNANIACFMTASIAGLMYNDDVAAAPAPTSNPVADLISQILDIIPGYKQILDVLPGY